MTWINVVKCWGENFNALEQRSFSICHTAATAISDRLQGWKANAWLKQNNLVL